MKTLKKLVLHKAKIMSAPQMKHIVGGYDEYSGGGGDEYDGKEITFSCCCDSKGPNPPYRPCWTATYRDLSSAINSAGQGCAGDVQCDKV